MAQSDGDIFEGHRFPAHTNPGRLQVRSHVRLALTFVQCLGHLARVPTSIRTAFFHPRALRVYLAAFNAGGGKPAGFLGGWAVPLLHGQDVLEELTASQALVVLLGEQGLRERDKANMLP